MEQREGAIYRYCLRKDPFLWFLVFFYVFKEQKVREEYKKRITFLMNKAMNKYINTYVHTYVGIVLFFVFNTPFKFQNNILFYDIFTAL